MIRVGVLAYLGTEQADQEWAPVQQFLQAAIPAHHINFVYLDLDEMSDAAINRSIDFVLTNPGHYVNLELSVGASRSEEHTSELQSLMRISYAVFCLKKKNR